MDVNPHQFTAPSNKFEFANFHLENNTSLLLLSMAWTYPENFDGIVPAKEVAGVKNRRDHKHGEMIEYWAYRLSPLIKSDEKVTIVICDRIGNETSEVNGVKSSVQFGGASCALQIENGQFKLLGNLDCYEQNVLEVEIE
jgi:protein N-terminal amidase